MNRKLLISIVAAIGLLGLFLFLMIFFPRTPKQSPQTLAPTIPQPTEQIEGDESLGAEQVVRETLETYRGQNPDYFVANHVPHIGTSFTIDLQFIPTPTPHYGFVVTAIAGDVAQAQIETRQWLSSLGLTEAQIARLEIINR